MKLLVKMFQYVYATWVFVAFVITFLIQLPIFIILAFLDSPKRPVLYYHIRVWAYVFFFLLAIPVRVKGKQHYKKGQTYIIISNHQSFLDTPMIFRTFTIPIKTLATIEYSKIPLFGYIYKKMTVMVDRSSPQSKKRSLEVMKKTLEEDGTSIFLFPEGSFNQTDDVLKPFFDGAFRTAKETNTAILPVIFPDTGKRGHYSSVLKWSSGISRAIILPPILMNEIEIHNIKELKEIAWDQMQVALSQAYKD